MSRDIKPFGLRLQPELRAKIEEASKSSGRSINAEIVARLESSFERENELLKEIRLLRGSLRKR